VIALSATEERAPDAPQGAPDAPQDLALTEVCEQCGAKFTTKQGLGAHRAQKHGYRNEKRQQARAKSKSEKVASGWKKNEPIILDETMTSKYQRPIDEYKLAAFQFLPTLGKEAHRRHQDGDDSLLALFAALYADVA
jgi:hypothetical protein